MELIAAIVLPGPLGYFCRTRKQGVGFYLLAWAVLFPGERLGRLSETGEHARRRRTGPAPGALRFASIAIVLMAAFVGLGACGGGNDDGDGDVAVAEQTAPESRTQDLDQFLMRNDDEPGFRRVEQPRTLTGVEAFVNDLRYTQDDAQRLRSEGFISFTVQPIRGPRTAGVTNVTLYETAEGAQRSLAHELRPDVIRELDPVENLRFFSVPGIPGARGWTASLPGEPASHDVGNLFWVQGRCMLVLGNQGPGPFAGPLSTGARAIYERTNGQCP